MLLSRNLVKQGLVKQRYAVVEPDEKRVIDTNELVEKRLRELEVRQSGGFVAGLEAAEIELLPEEDEEGSSSAGNSAENAANVLENARQEAEAIVAEAKAEAMRLCEEAKTQAEIEKNRILTEAKQQGYAEGISRAQTENQAIKQEYLERERQLQNMYQQQMDEMEPQLVELITDIYQYIFQVELHSYHEILVHLISSTLRKAEREHDFLIHVSKEDYPYVSSQKKQISAEAVSANCNVEVVEDMTLAKNECLIEADGGIFDCGLGTQLSELRQRLTLLSWSREES